MLLNFVVVGDQRSGAGLVQGTLCNRGDVFCHSNNLFHHDDQVRRATHEDYFGPGRDPDTMPEWFRMTETNPWQYLQQMLFDNTMQEERALGVHLNYADVQRWELCDLFHERWREGDFCLVHVTRNPLHCLVSLKQAQRGGVWGQDYRNEVDPRPAHPVSLDMEELVTFCRAHEAMRRRLAASCDDMLEISYHALSENYQTTMHKVFRFLELPDSVVRAVPATRRLRQWPLPRRIANFTLLRKSVPSDVRPYFE